MSDAFRSFVNAIVAGDAASFSRMLKTSPELASAQSKRGDTRQEPKANFFDAILHYIYEGDTALHLAAAAYRTELARRLVAAGADLAATNRRGAGPLHYAVDGGPGAPHWNPRAQAAMVAYLIGAGADPNAVDKGGVTPLHRAVRNRCASAVRALLSGGADPRRKNKNGSTVLSLATLTTGRGGTGSDLAKAQQREILQLLERRR